MIADQMAVVARSCGGNAEDIGETCGWIDVSASTVMDDDGRRLGALVALGVMGTAAPGVAVLLTNHAW
jgi:hypothetical protein